LSATAASLRAAAPTPAPWHIQVGRRMRAHIVLKHVAIVALFVPFFAVYFLLLDYPVLAVTTVPRTGLDALVGFQPESLWLYASLWFYVPIAPSLIFDRRDLMTYYKAMIVLSVVAMFVFLVWPTASPRPDVDWTQFPAFGPLIEADGAGNALPSLHAAFAVFTAIWIDRLLRCVGAPGLLRMVSALWCVGILWSTLATGQHVAVDLYSGCALGWLAAELHRRVAPAR
jgi:hypothetical protein